MQHFASKPTPTDDKLRGGYYTPEPIARFIAQWVAQAGHRLLEPSCGDGAILNELSKITDAGTEVIGVELLKEEAAKARQSSGVKVIEGDFFEWFEDKHEGTFDGVAGNPPYIRFGSWAEESRTLALDLMRAQGLKPSRLTNAWVPFIVASIIATRAGGRVGLVIPAELLQVGYAAELRSFLVDSCENLTVVSFRKLVFPKIQQEIVLLMAVRGEGPAEIRTVEFDDAFNLDELDLNSVSAARAELHEREKWTKYYLDSSQIELLRKLRNHEQLTPLKRIASVDVGVVTGRNAFFCMTGDEANQRGLTDVVIPLVARSVQVKGIKYTLDDQEAQASESINSRLLHLPAKYEISEHPSLATYIAAGEAAGVHTGYKCSIRREWWVVPSVSTPEAFMLRQISTHPRIIANQTNATSTDTVHRVRLAEGISAEKLSVAAFNSVTFAMSEIMGRSYGGGVLELEPSEAESLPVPDPSMVPEEIIDRVDQLVRNGEIEAALDLVDTEVLVKRVGLDKSDVAASRKIWMRLRDRRIGRKSAPKKLVALTV